jgi:hypothetical protein
MALDLQVPRDPFAQNCSTPRSACFLIMNNFRKIRIARLVQPCRHSMQSIQLPSHIIYKPTRLKTGSTFGETEALDASWRSSRGFETPGAARRRLTKKSSLRACRKNLCCNSCAAVGRCAGSFARHSATNSLAACNRGLQTRSLGVSAKSTQYRYYTQPPPVILVVKLVKRT